MSTGAAQLQEEAIADLVEISRFAGERFDLVQAGGGNTSVKLDDGRIFVKASGMALSDVSSQSDFCEINWAPMLDFLDSENLKDNIDSVSALDARAQQAVAAASAANQKRPSIEALLHCALGRFTLHTHPVAVAAVVCRPDWQEVLQKQFVDADFVPYFVPYRTPGAALALVLRAQLQQRNFQAGETAVIFLQNHGLIVAGRDKQTVMQKTNFVVDQLAQALPYNLLRYKLVNFASALVNQVCGTSWLAYLSDDQMLHAAVKENAQLLLAQPATPDQLVYCGAAGIAIDNLDSEHAVAAVAAHLKAYGHPPKLLLCGSEHIILLGASLRKCRESEEVLRSHVMLQQGGSTSHSAVDFLSSDEVHYLNNWEAEKYRQTL